MLIAFILGCIPVLHQLLYLLCINVDEIREMALHVPPTWVWLGGQGQMKVALRISHSKAFSLNSIDIYKQHNDVNR